MSIDILKCNKCKNKNTTKCNCKLVYTKYGTVFDHTLAVLDSLDENANFELQIAALYHDVGKNENTFKNRNGKFSFINHEKEGKNITKGALKKLKFDNNQITFICNLIERHMDIHKLAKVTDKAVRKFLRECNVFMEDLFVLVDADCLGTYCLHKNTYELNNIIPHEDIKVRAREINEEMKKLAEKPFRYFNGNELMEYFKIEKPCKEVGILLDIQNKIIDEYGFYLDKDKVLKMIKGRFNNV
jgi:poly(A) polymerase